MLTNFITDACSDRDDIKVYYVSSTDENLQRLKEQFGLDTCTACKVAGYPSKSASLS